ncbi:MAG: hypothetical protein Kow00121_63640 [Elainellaceae cyanobacterium]
MTETKSEAAEQALRSYPYAQMQLLHTIVGHSLSGETSYFAISTDKKVLLSDCHSESTMGSALKTLNIWDLQTGKLTDTLYTAHERIGTEQDGQIIVSSFQHIISVWKNWEMERRPLQIYGWIDIGSLAVSADGSIVACGGRRRPEPLGQIDVWDLRECQFSFDPSQKIKKSKLQKKLSGTHPDSQAVKPTRRIQWQPSRSVSCILRVMISPDNSLLLSQDEYRRGDFHRLWNLQTGELIRVFETSPYWLADAIANTVAGRCLVSGIRDQSVKVWDLNTDQVVYSFPGYHPIPGRSPTAMTPDGQVLAYCNDASEIVLWNLKVDQEIRTLLGNTSPIQSICLSSDREWVVSYDAEQIIRIYGLLDE